MTVGAGQPKPLPFKSMHTLFGKIFVWFFAAQIVLSAALFGVSTATTRIEPSSRNWRGVVTEMMLAQSRAAAAADEAGVPAPLTSLMSRRPGNTPSTAFLFVSRDNWLALRETSIPGEPAPVHLAQQALFARETIWENVNGKRLAAIATMTPSGTRYVLVREFQRPVITPFAEFRRPTVGTFLRLLTLFTVMGVVSYGLARYLAAPVTSLRAVTHEIAEGNMAARVGPRLGRRRDELTALGADFDRMASRLELLLKSHGRLLGDISHELRSPLARLNVALDLAEGEGVSQQARDAYLARIRRESEQLNELIGQILTINRLENGFPAGTSSAVHRRQSFSSVDLVPLLEEIASDADFEAQAHNRAVRLTVDHPCLVLGDDALLRSAIENVVRNAIRYTDENTTVEITLRGAKNNEGCEAAHLSVRDFGPGVPEESLPELFRPFYRVADARDRKTGGTGLGLAIAQRAVVLHEGQVTAANAPGGGLLIEFTLPCGEEK